MEYMTIPKMARELDLSDNTVRRYIKRYPQFFQKTMIDRWEQYPVDPSLRLIRRISEISESGKRRSEVLAVLESEFDVVAKPEAQNGRRVNSALNGDTDMFISQFVHLLAENENFVDQLASILVKNEPFINRLSQKLELEAQ